MYVKKKKNGFCVKEKKGQRNSADVTVNPLIPCACALLSLSASAVSSHHMMMNSHMKIAILHTQHAATHIHKDRSSLHTRLLHTFISTLTPHAYPLLLENLHLPKWHQNPSLDQYSMQHCMQLTSV